MSLEIHLKGLLSRFRYQLKQVPAELWRDDLQFADAWARVSGHTLMDPTSAFLLVQFARRTAGVEGDAAELGVYRGGSASLLAHALPGKTLHLFDTFTGLPGPEATDLHAAGDFASTLDETKRFLDGVPALAFHAGEFPTTARPLSETRFAFVHLDADLRRSTADGLEFFWPRLSPGGVVVVDDYGIATCPGVRAAVDAYFEDKPERPLILPTGQCVLLR